MQSCQSTDSQSRYIHLDLEVKDLPLLAESPHASDMLPTDGVVWGEQGFSSFRKRVNVTVLPSVHLGTFQRSAQAAVLLHDTYLWSAGIRQSPVLPPVPELAHIFQSIRDLVDAMLHQVQGWEVFCDAFAMCMRSAVHKRANTRPSIIELLLSADIRC